MSCFVFDAIVNELEIVFVIVFVCKAVDDLGDLEQSQRRDRLRVLCELGKLEELYE